MIVSGGHILAIDGVDHDLTLSGDGVKTPIGITEELLEKIRDVSGKLDKTAFETWSAQTEHWDVQEYSGGEGIKVENHIISVSAKYLTSGDLEPYATKQWVKDQEFLTSGDLEPYAKTQWVQEELDKKQDASAMSAYATSAWVDENFQPKGDYITPEDLEPYATSAWVNEGLGKKVDLTAMSAYATSAWVDENFLKQADYHEYSVGNDYIRIDEYKVYGYDWTSAVSAVPFKLDTSSFEQYSGWADDTYLKEDALNNYKRKQEPVSAVIESGYCIEYISDITQDVEGIIYPVKKTIPDGTVDNKGIVSISEFILPSLSAETSKVPTEYAVKKYVNTYDTIPIPEETASQAMLFNDGDPLTRRWVVWEEIELD